MHAEPRNLTPQLESIVRLPEQACLNGAHNRQR
jgi:hypothetical protein